MTSLRHLVFALLCATWTTTSFATEYSMGSTNRQSGMTLDAVYLQPIVMEPAGMMLDAAKSDIHLELDIHADAKNSNGFEEGAWIPYLTGKYHFQKKGSSKIIEGDLMAMVASDGPHYGDNVKLDGVGEYTLTVDINPPGSNGTHFGRHTDRETGVGAWFAPFQVQWTFVYAGIGKKGGY